MATVKLRTKSSKTARFPERAPERSSERVERGERADRSDRTERSDRADERTEAVRLGRPANRRGSPEAIEKRRVARVFNDILGGRGASAHKLDGRTEKRRQRLLKELEAGKARGSRELKPLDVLQRVQELMDLGEPLSSIRKVTKVRKSAVAPEAIVRVVERLHRAYSFRPEVYRFVGIGEEVLREAGVLADASKRRAQVQGLAGAPAVSSRRVFWYEDAWLQARTAGNPGFSRFVARARRGEPRGRRPSSEPRALRHAVASPASPALGAVAASAQGAIPRATPTRRGARRSCSPSARARSRSASSRITSPGSRPISSRPSARRARPSPAPTSSRSSCAISSSRAGAEQRGLDKELPTSQLLTRALSSATLRKTRSGYPSAAAIPMDDVRRYYDENRTRFDSPERINLWRILCKTREEANTVLETARREPTIAKYNDLARDHSIDKATNMRGGNLGFVGPDGASNEAGVKVDPAIVKAAQTVKDGELVAAAGRRGLVRSRSCGAAERCRRTSAASRTSAAQIRAALFRERTESSEKKLIDELRAKNVKEVNAGLLGIIELRPFDAGLGAPRSPAGSTPPPARSLTAARRASSPRFALSAASAAARSATRFERPSPTPSTSSPISTSTSKVGSCCGPRMPFTR